MPFIEIVPKPEFVKISKNGRALITAGLIKRYFNLTKRVKVFHDEENKKIGLKCADVGYKLSVVGSSYGIQCTKLGRITQGKFNPEWSKKHEMLIISYGE